MVANHRRRGPMPSDFCVRDADAKESHFPGLSDNHISLLRGTFPGYLRVHILKDTLIGSAVSAIDKHTQRTDRATGITCSFCSVMSCNHLVRFLLQYMFYYFAFFCVFFSLFCVRVRVYVCLCFCRPYLSSCRCFVAVLSSWLWIFTACDCCECMVLGKMKWNEISRIVLLIADDVLSSRYGLMRQARCSFHWVSAVADSWHSPVTIASTTTSTGC